MHVCACMGEGGHFLCASADCTCLSCLTHCSCFSKGPSAGSSRPSHTTPAPWLLLLHPPEAMHSPFGLWLLTERQAICLLARKGALQTLAVCPGYLCGIQVTHHPPLCLCSFTIASCWTKLRPSPLFPLFLQDERVRIRPRAS